MVGQCSFYNINRKFFILALPVVFLGRVENIMQLPSFQKKGQVGLIVGGVVAIIVGVILMIGVTVPIVADVVANQSFTGVNATIANNLTTFLLIGALLLIVGVAVLGFNITARR